MFMKLYQNATWEEAHKLLDRVVQQVDVSNDMKREQKNIAAEDLQQSCLH